MTGREPMGELQALVTGIVWGALMKAPQYGFTIEAEPAMDDDGYLPEVRVRGFRSNERLVIRIEQVER